ncbi:hypothetical protein SZ64_10415 [Erythrobacter sp. SG61-1L]|uniref:hypothetical protein n=1 Tax=Erythrobacter sp. SG61-1L TaxID=1603897 RepID=UPI0006C91762|nr:hypothetical protein [Erythrobacter sp. SG61-1L]KPL68485.1 hypothetical protein SZ64_10415 [Erythrobacter sp. SG61-1L]
MDLDSPTNSAPTTACNITARPGYELCDIAEGNAYLVSDHCAFAQLAITEIGNAEFPLDQRQQALDTLCTSTHCALVLSGALASDPDYAGDAFAGIAEIFTKIDSLVTNMLESSVLNAFGSDEELEEHIGPARELTDNLDLSAQAIELACEIAFACQRQGRDVVPMVLAMRWLAILLAGIGGNSVVRLKCERFTPGEQRAEMMISLKSAQVGAQIYQALQRINASWENGTEAPCRT